jgi:hypothetical protein
MQRKLICHGVKGILIPMNNGLVAPVQLTGELISDIGPGAALPLSG